MLSYNVHTNEELVYAVAPYGSSEGLRSFGKSDPRFLDSCFEPQFQKEDLANTHALSLREHDFMPNSWSVIYLKDTSFDWKNSTENISGLYNELLRIHSVMRHSF